MATQDVQRVQQVLDARLQVYKKQCAAFAPPRSAEDAKDCLSESLEYYMPYSIFLVLLALRWCLDHTPEEVEEGFVFDMAVEDILDVSDTWAWVPYENPKQGVTYESSVLEGERLRRAKREEFDTWPRDDCVAVYEWMSLAETWPFVQREYRERLAAAIGYWRARVEGGTRAW